jgi:hypothetical protein
MSSIIKDSLKKILYQVSKPVLGRIGKFNGIHKGESCYIFGDGVSTKSMDLKLFADKTAIAVNYFPFHKEFDTLSCSYCVVNAPHFFSPLFGYEPAKKKHLLGMSKLYRDLISCNPQINYFVDLSNYFSITGDNVYYMFRDIPDRRLGPDFISRRTFCFGGVSRAAIMLAIYLGFDHIYLVGFDYTHVPPRGHHYYEKGRGVFFSSLNYQKDFLEIAKDFTDITTITLDGTSDFINAVTYREFTGREPAFRENTELVDERYLKALATWSGYAIY